MNRFNVWLIGLLTLGVLLALPLTSVSAASSCTAQELQTNIFKCACGTNKAAASNVACKTTAKDPITGADGVLSKVQIIVAIVGGIAAVFIVIISGFKFITADGDPQKVANARTSLIYTLIGVAIIIIANGIVAFVVKGL